MAISPISTVVSKTQISRNKIANAVELMSPDPKLCSVLDSGVSGAKRCGIGGKMAVSDIGAIKRAFNASLVGLFHCLRKERAFQQELLLFLPLSLVAVFISSQVWDWLLLTLPLIFVLIVEVLNTGLEAVVDRVGVEHHELSGLAKDCGSAAVLLAMLAAVLIWGAYLFEYFS